MRNLDVYKQLYKDDRFYNEVFIRQDYKDVFDKKKDIVLDVGALAGEFSFWIQGGTVYAIEPEAEYYEELISNIEEFGFHNVKPFNIALSGESGERNFSTGTRGGSVLNDAGSARVKTLSLFDFMQDNNIPYIDILKIDIENGEHEVFGAESFKEVAPKIKCIIGEHLGGIRPILEANGFKLTSEFISNQLYER